MSALRSGHNGTAPLPDWEQLTPLLPAVVDTMRRYLQQIGCILRPRSVTNTDICLRCFAGFLAECYPQTRTVAAVGRRHIEEYKPWLAARPGQKAPRLMAATIAHRLGTLRMFFLRISEWGWDEAPPRVPILLGDVPRQDHPLPKALDDAAAAKLLRAARADRKPLVRLSVEVLLRTGMRVSEYTTLPADAIVPIGPGYWLHVPVGKLREDRYLPLHPELVTLIGDYRERHMPAGAPWLITRRNGTPLDRHAVTRHLNRAAAAAGLGHVHPHQMRHTLATQAEVRGIAFDATSDAHCDCLPVGERLFLGLLAA